MIDLAGWLASPMAGTIALTYAASVFVVSTGAATLLDHYRWAALACPATVLLVLTVGGLAAGWGGFTWDSSSRFLKGVGLTIGLGLPCLSAFVGVLLARRKSVLVRAVSGLVVGGLAALVAPTVWLLAVCSLTGDCL